MSGDETDRAVDPAASLRPPVRVFAVEDDRIQLDWRSLPAGLLEVDVPGAPPVRVEIAAGPGALEITGLTPDAAGTASVRLGDDVALELAFRTLPPPVGEVLARIATISDLHVGTPGFDLRERMLDDDPTDPHPQRCGRAAIDEAAAWGAERLVVKGDITASNRAPQWQAAGEMLAGSPMPVRTLAGNHDTYLPDGHADPDAASAAAGIPIARGVEVHDIGGLRLVLLDTTIAGRGHGRVAHVRTEAADAVHDAAGGALVLMHHHVQPLPIAYHWPPGIPSQEGLPFLRDLARANPCTFVSSGHTHRNRRRPHQVLTITEVGSVKDYPGVWAGYVVSEGGIRQVLRRVAAPSAIAWTERTGDAVFGTWRHWSTGTLQDRCFAVPWAP